MNSLSDLNEERKHGNGLAQILKFQAMAGHDMALDNRVSLALK